MNICLALSLVLVLCRMSLSLQTGMKFAVTLCDTTRTSDKGRSNSDSVWPGSCNLGGGTTESLTYAHQIRLSLLWYKSQSTKIVLHWFSRVRWETAKQFPKSSLWGCGFNLTSINFWQLRCKMVPLKDNFLLYVKSQHTIINLFSFFFFFLLLVRDCRGQDSFLGRW